MRRQGLTMAAIGGLALSATVSAAPVRVTVTSNAPVDGAYLTPVWVGFHNGSFDSYDGGAASAVELERLAEDGNTGPLSGVFNANGTLVATGIVQTGSRVDGTIGAAPIGPGGSAELILDVADDGSNGFFSYASMVLPSSDYFVANGSPTAHDLSALLAGTVSRITIDIGLPATVNDAGTEVNDFATSAGNGLFGIPGGQGGPNVGLDEGGVNSIVASPFANFLNNPTNIPVGSNQALDFNDVSLYPRGIATITLQRVPEPATLGIAALGLLLGASARRTRPGAA